MAQIRSLQFGSPKSQKPKDSEHLSLTEFHSFTSKIVENLRKPCIPLPSNVGDYNLATFFQEHVFESQRPSKNTLGPLDKFLERNVSSIVAELLDDENLFKKFYHIRWF